MSNTYDAVTMSELLAKCNNKPVYAYAGFNYYRVIRVIDTGDCIILETPESDGCWMPIESIRESLKKEQENQIQYDDGPLIA